MKPYPFSGLNHFTVPCAMRMPSFAQTRQPGALHVQGRVVRCLTKRPKAKLHLRPDKTCNEPTGVTGDCYTPQGGTLQEEFGVFCLALKPRQPACAALTLWSRGGYHPVV